MSKYTDFELEELEKQRYRKPKKAKPVEVTPKKARKKESYESNADVQRWLQEQTLKTDELSKAAFNPTFLAGKRDESWILSSLTDFYEQDLITDVVHVVKSGKEATVYCCIADAKTGLTHAAAKIYRPRMFRSLKNDAVYRLGRTQRDLDGNVTRRTQRDAFKSERGRAAQVSSWIDFEFSTHTLLYNAGVDVPQPLAHVGNAVLMAYIGEEGEPAPLLRDVKLTREEAPALFERVLHNIELCLAHNRIHGDLSEYNILYWQGNVLLIDFAQAVDPRQNTDVFPLLARDIARVCHYFARSGINADAEGLARDMWKKYQG
jgi:RIO kinase 1